LLHALSICTHPFLHKSGVSTPLPVSQLRIARLVSDTSLSILCDTSDHILSGLFFDNSFLNYTGSRLKTACLEGRGFYPIYRQ
jgi:hypothetical protein